MPNRSPSQGRRGALLSELAYHGRGALVSGGQALSGTELVMVEARGCTYCAAWDSEIGPIYPRSAEGRFAPLRRIDLGDPLPDDLTLTSRPTFTPTFILTEDGQELARIEGYPGEAFFWGLLGTMLTVMTGYGGSGS